jgi:hypothetical protein
MNYFVAFLTGDYNLDEPSNTDQLGRVQGKEHDGPARQQYL